MFWYFCFCHLGFGHVDFRHLGFGHFWFVFCFTYFKDPDFTFFAFVCALAWKYWFKTMDLAFSLMNILSTHGAQMDKKLWGSWQHALGSDAMLLRTNATLLGSWFYFLCLYMHVCVCMCVPTRVDMCDNNKSKLSFWLLALTIN